MDEIDPTILERAAEILRAGGLVAYPTDTVYGLAALPSNDDAVRRLFAAKRRDPSQPTPILIDDAARVASLATGITEAARRLMSAFWPGALTVVMPKAPSFRTIAIGETVGLRVPDHPVPRELSRLLDSPITGSSANDSDGPEPLTAEDVREQLGDVVDHIIDGGRCRGGTPSTVVDCTTDPIRVLRHGAIDRSDVFRVAERERPA